MAKNKPAPKKKGVAPKDHEDEGVKVSVEKTKRNPDGTTLNTNLKGVLLDEAEAPTSQLKSGQAVVGLSKGYSVNLGNYESAKISCWISKTSGDSEVDILNTLAEVSSLLDEQLEFELSELREDE